MQRRNFLALALAAPTLTTRAFADEPQVRLRELYNKDMSFTEFATSNEGKRVAIEGFMAPPLKAESNFYVLTNRPMAVCPFCSSEAEWPNDILAVYAQRIVDVIPFNVKIVTRGTLELGTHTDPELGFVSRVRIVDAVQVRA
ncbi:hypothetical protein [Paracoccus saliphilus]|uniref:DUF3299 domain-containing protein n=1 Tax=Paracoccus saliphilus TaxID=405559 RepID=A0AA45W7W7_9RHOB|nr:hypothetical protein [Paracoccus saliphilus]WCR04809.1 hypothetical protein JHX88_08910 [Paracoccus saliphilus]SIT12868.1 hypothetical protein SAMN05421772_12220 [Paracoccus saliphilus]